MCDLCSQDVHAKNDAVLRHVELSNQLMALSDAYLKMATGRLNPHGSEVRALEPIVAIVREELNNCWLQDD